MTTSLVIRNDLDDVPSQEVAHAISSAMEQLKGLRTYIKAQFDIGGTDKKDGKYYPGLDAGKIPGCGDKETLFLPGAQKAVMYFNARPIYKIRQQDLPGGHVTFRIRCVLISRASREEVGEGVGCCSTLESKYRYRRAERFCPSCGAPAIIKGREEFGGGWVCFKKKDGCGAKFKDGHTQIESQPQGQVENENLADQYNTILKMAKKRAFVDAAITLGCLSELFTQDIEDTYAPAHVVQAARPYEGEVVDVEPDPSPIRPPGQSKPENKGLFTKANVARTDEFLEWINRQCGKINDAWSTQWDARLQGALADGYSVPDKIPDVINPYQFKGHLLKWAKSTGRLDPRIAPETARSREAEAYLAAIFHASPEEKQAIKDEMAEYLQIQKEMVSRPIYQKHDHLRPDGWEEEQAEAEADHGDAYQGPDEIGKDS